MKASTQYQVTPSELAIVKMIADGLTAPEIAEKRKISVKTVEVHRHNILRKTKCLNAPHLVATFIRNKIIE